MVSFAENSAIAVAPSSGSERAVSDANILSEAEIDQLLKEAETRLREAQKGQALQKRQSYPTLSSLPKLKSSPVASPYVEEQNGIARADSARLLEPDQRKLADDIYVPGLSVRKDQRKAEETAGVDWFDMPKTDLTPQLKRDFRLLEMRSVLDPHRHYKNMGKAKIPAFSQVGTVIEGPTEYFSARLNNRDRKQTLAEEILAGEKENRQFKRKYDEIQQAKTSGKKAHYKKLKEQRKRRT